MMPGRNVLFPGEHRSFVVMLRDTRQKLHGDDARAVQQQRGERSSVHKRVVAGLLALFAALVALMVLAQPASADGEQLSGRIENRIDGVKTPLAGVTITAVGGGFEGSATTGDDGKWVIPVPAQGDYEVTIGQSTATTTTLWEQAAQLTVSGIQFGLMIALGALGLSIIYGTTGLTNFAHGEILTFGALATWTFNAGFGLPFVLAAVLGLVLTGLFGWLNNAALWKPLRKRGTGLIAMMIVSIGLALLLRNLYLFFYGGDKAAYAEYAGLAGLTFGPVSITPTDIVSMIVAVVALAAVVLIIGKTRMGKATRAVSDNPSLASSAGINVERVITFVWVLGAALAGLGGILLGFTQQVSFQMGFQILLLIFAAVTLGGLGTISGAIVGSLVVGLFLQLTTLVIPTELKSVGALLVLIVILLVRPYGLLGRRERVG
jgi:branched-chain amino acid transport system permease protein